MASTRFANLFFSHDGKSVDKWEQYLTVYEVELERFVRSGNPVNLLEIGVQNGGSLELWEKYLPSQSTIIGIDIDPKVGELVFTGNINVFVADVNDEARVDKALGSTQFDVIIDDGSRRSANVMATFKSLFNRLRPGGKFFIQDLHAGYLRSHEGGFRLPRSSIEWRKTLVDALNADHFEGGDAVPDFDREKLGALNPWIARLTFYDSVLVIEKLGSMKTAPYRRVFSGSATVVSDPAEFLANAPKEIVAPALVGEARAAGMIEKRAVTASLVRSTARMRRKRSGLEKLWWRIRAVVQPKKADLAILRRSLFLDEEWYLATYTEAATAGMRPAEHYMAVGAKLGLDPGPFFPTRDYLASNPEVAKAGLNPLLHFEKYGWRQNRVLFDAELDELDCLAIRRHIASLAVQPLISVVMPVYDPPIEFLRQAVESVIAQSYSHWRLCIADDASRNPDVPRLLDELATKDRRIRVVHRASNGHVCAASNSALDIAEGDFVALMDHDDLLHETALYEVAVEINAHPDVDMIYSDEDRIDPDGNRSEAYFKSDFNPELLLGQNMINHLGVYRRSLIEKIGGFRPDFEGSQDYDLVLRAWAASSIDRIRHIPAALYHWRRGGAQAPSFSQAQLERCVTVARKAIQEFLDREGEGAKVIPAPNARHWSRVVRQVPEPKPLVSVIVLTKDRADLVAVCADGILNKTDYPNLELLIVDHESKERRSRDLFEKLKRDPRVRIVPYVGAFNFSAMNNMAAADAKGTVLALVNNDIEIIGPDWLAEMVSHAVRPEIGAVGAKLFYPDGRIQHAGILVGMGGLAGHSFLREKGNSPGYFGQAVLTRAVSAVTGACLVVRRSVFLEVNGLDAEAFPVAFNDVDFCLKIQAKGYRNVWTPFAELVHHESLSRGNDDAPDKKPRFAKECANFRSRWIGVIENDPCHNPNLSLQSAKYEVAQVSRRRKPWAGYM